MPRMITSADGTCAIAIADSGTVRGKPAEVRAFLSGAQAFPIRRTLWTRLFPWRTVCQSSHWTYQQNVRTGERRAIRRGVPGHMPHAPDYPAT